jgi:hypothetical protein
MADPNYLEAESDPGEYEHGSVEDVRQVGRDHVEEGDPQVDVVQEELAQTLAQDGVQFKSRRSAH